MKGKKKLVLVGGGGHCSAVIDVIEQQGIYEVAGIVDLPSKLGSKILGYEVKWADQEFASLVRKFGSFCVTLGHTGNPDRRKALFESLKKMGGVFPVIVSPHAYVSDHAWLGAGTVVMHHAIVNASARVGENCILNTGSLVEHDVSVGDRCHISTAAVLNGNVSVGADSFIGSGAVVKHGTSIGRNCIVGAGAVVVKDLLKPGTYVGIPAKQVEKLQSGKKK